MFGVIGDRIGHRDLLAMMRATYAVLASTLMTLALTGHLTPTYVMVIVAVMGLVRPSDLGVRGALVANIMPRDHLVGAISVSRTTMDTARIAGALSGAGLFAALGIGPAYMAIVTLYVVAHAVDALRGGAGETASQRRRRPMARCAARRCATSRKASPMSGPRRECAPRSGSRSWPI